MCPLKLTYISFIFILMFYFDLGFWIICSVLKCNFSIFFLYSVPLNGFTLHVLALPRSQKGNGIAQSAPLKEKRSRVPYHSIFIDRNIFVVKLGFVLWKCFWEEWISGKPKIEDLVIYEVDRYSDPWLFTAWRNLVLYSTDMSEGAIGQQEWCILLLLFRRRVQCFLWKH